jgi:hypothetical protein
VFGGHTVYSVRRKKKKDLRNWVKDEGRGGKASWMEGTGVRL